MSKRGAVVVIMLVAAAVGGALWWHQRDRGAPAVAPARGSTTALATARSAAAIAAHAQLTVSVADDHGPIAGALVRLAPGDDNDGDIVVLRTGGDGRVRSGELVVGDWRVSASADGHAPAAAPTVTLHAGDDARVAIVLTAGGRALTGTITDATGGPIAGARIDAAVLDARAAASDAVATTLSGADGHYRLTVAGGQLLVAVSDVDYAPVSRYVEVGPTGATADFALIPGGAIEGVVHDERTHEAVPGAAIEVRRDSPAIALAETGAARLITAKPDGTFRASGLAPGRYELRARADVRSSRTATVLGLGVAEQHTGVELLVGRGPVLRGVVVDELGAPVPGAKVIADAPATRGEATATAAGTFELGGLQPGHYVAFATTPLHLPAGNVEVTLDTHDVDDVRLVVHRGAELRGHVEPRQIATVAITSAMTGPLVEQPLAPVTTGADGEFVFRPLAAGPTRLRATAPSGAAGDAAITVGKDVGEVVIELAPGGSIAGRVVDGDGKALAAVTVVASASADDQMTIVNGVVTSGTQAITTATGEFELRGLTAGEFQLRVLERSHPLALRSKPESATVALTAGEHKTGVELAVDRPSGKISGTVLGADGAPIADAWVSVHQNLADMLAGLAASGAQQTQTSITADSVDGAADTPPVLTDATGHFEIGGLTHGTYQVIAEASAGKLRGRASDVVPDAAVTIQLAAPTSLTGTVHGVTAADPAFDVALTGPTVATRSFADPAGGFSFRNLDPGAYTLHVTSSAGAGDAAVQVAVGQVATADVTLVANATVVGKLVDASGAAVAGVPVTVVPDSHDGKLSITMSSMPPSSGPDGAFRIAAPAGDGTFVALTRPRAVTRAGLKLVAGQTADLGNVIIDAAAGSGSGSP